MKKIHTFVNPKPTRNIVLRFCASLRQVIETLPTAPQFIGPGRDKRIVPVRELTFQALKCHDRSSSGVPLVEGLRARDVDQHVDFIHVFLMCCCGVGRC